MFDPNTAHDMHDMLILGVGNPLCGDDALGIYVIQQLQARTDLPPHVTVVDGGTDGIGLVPLIEAYQRVIVVDAVLMDLPPGTIRRFTWHEVHVMRQEHVLSLHQSDLSDALALADALGCLPQNVVIYGVQPQHQGWDQPLSQAVERALPIVIEALINEVRSKN